MPVIWKVVKANGSLFLKKKGNVIVDLTWKRHASPGQSNVTPHQKPAKELPV